VEQRTQLVLRLLSKGRSRGAQITRRAGISEQTSYRWRDEFVRGGSAGLAGRRSAAVQAKEIARLQEQMAKRDRVIGEIIVANRILKKLSGQERF